MLPAEINGYSIIGAMHTGDDWLIIAEGWRNDGLVYVVASYTDGDQEWSNGRYFDGSVSRINRANAKAHFAQAVSDAWS